MNNFTDLIGNIPAWPFTIIASLIAILGGIYLFRLKSFSDASSVFRAAFADALSALRNSDACPFSILNPAFSAHEAAVYEFSRFLGFKRKAFLRAWDQYAYHKRQKNYPFLEQYSSAGQSIGENQKRRKLAIERLEHLLSFAKVA